MHYAFRISISSSFSFKKNNMLWVALDKQAIDTLRICPAICHSFDLWVGRHLEDLGPRAYNRLVIALDIFIRVFSFFSFDV